MSLRAHPVRYTLIPALVFALGGVALVQTQTELHPAIGWFVGINLGAYLVWAIDKRQAKKDGFRVPEWTLHLMSMLGAGVAGVIAMQTLRHKTRKRVFRWSQPLLAAAGVSALGWLLWR